MKILILSELYEPAINGVVTSLKSLRQGLLDRGHDVRVLTLADGSSFNEEEGVYYVFSRAMDFIYPGARAFLQTDWAVYEEILAWGPDLVHTQSEFSTFRLARHLVEDLVIPHIHTYHTAYEDYTHYIHFNKTFGKKMVASITRRLLNASDRVIVPTEKIQRLLKEYQVDSPIEVVPTGIQLGAFFKELPEEKKTALKEALNISLDQFVLIFVGRLGMEKGIEELIYYVNRLRDAQLTLLIVGEGPYGSHLRRLVSELGLTDQIIFTGEVQPAEVPKYYQIADVFVSASTSETQGLTFVESLACRKPALCRRDAALDNLIIAGQTGYQYDNFLEFKAYLTALREDKVNLSQMGERAQNYVKLNFSSDRFAQRVENIYEKAIEEKGWV